MESDPDLLRRWGEGDEKAGRALFDRYFEPLYRFFCNKLDDGVEDLVQETFLACVEGRERFRNDASFRTFLFSVARNRLYKRWRRYERKEGRLDFGVSSVVDIGLSPSAAAAKSEEAHWLLLGLRKIPADLQIALELHYWEEMPAPQIAEILEIPEGTARSRLRRGRELLGAQLRELSGAPNEINDDSLQQWIAAIRQQLSLESSSASSPSR